MPPLPKWFMPVAVVALLWNLMGCAAYLSDMMMSPEALAALPADQQALYAARPSWAVAMYAIAVWGGALGSLGLVMRKKWAKGALLASLLGLIGQDIGLFWMSGVAVPGSAYVLQGVVLLIAVLLLVLSTRAARDGWLS